MSLLYAVDPGTLQSALVVLEQTPKRSDPMRCKKCGAFIGNGGWIPFGKCKRCGENW